MTVDVDALAPGQRIPTWRREGTLDAWNRFAAVSGDFSGHHMDDEIGRHEGFPGAFIMAPFSHAYLHGMLRDWLPDDGRIVTVDLRLKNPLLRGRTLEAGGEITAVRRERDEVIVDLEIWQVDDEGTPLGAGTATVAFPTPSG
jgi:acyl dehydratase